MAIKREDALKRIAELLERRRLSGNKAHDVAEHFLSLATSINGLSTLVIRNQNRNLKRTKKVKGLSYAALEAMQNLSDNISQDLISNSIELTIKSKLGVTYGLGDIKRFMETFDEHVQAIEMPNAKTTPKSIVYHLAEAFLAYTGDYPCASDKSMETRTTFEKICSIVSAYTGIKITKTQMKKACISLRNKT